MLLDVLGKPRANKIVIVYYHKESRFGGGKYSGSNASSLVEPEKVMKLFNVFAGDSIVLWVRWVIDPFDRKPFRQWRQVGPDVRNDNCLPIVRCLVRYRAHRLSESAF